MRGHSLLLPFISLISYLELEADHAPPAQFTAPTHKRWFREYPHSRMFNTIVSPPAGRRVNAAPVRR